MQFAKTVSRHADVQISGRFDDHCQPFLSGSVRKGRPVQIQMQKNGQLLCNSQYAHAIILARILEYSSVAENSLSSTF
jgi:hypothetical protein